MLIEEGATVYGKALSFEEHVQPLVKQFHEFDIDGSGSLDNDDLLRAIATKRAEKKAAMMSEKQDLKNGSASGLLQERAPANDRLGRKFVP